MFRCYQNSWKCYAYLTDVTEDHESSSLIATVASKKTENVAPRKGKEQTTNLIPAGTKLPLQTGALSKRVTGSIVGGRFRNL